MQALRCSYLCAKNLSLCAAKILAVAAWVWVWVWVVSN